MPKDERTFNDKVFEFFSYGVVNISIVLTVPIYVVAKSASCLSYVLFDTPIMSDDDFIGYVMIAFYMFGPIICIIPETLVNLGTKLIFCIPRNLKRLYNFFKNRQSGN